MARAQKRYMCDAMLACKKTAIEYWLIGSAFSFISDFDAHGVRAISTKRRSIL